jgi:hypothetical protein
LAQIETNIMMIYIKSILAGVAALTLAGLAGSALALLTLREVKNKFPDPPYSVEWHFHPWSILGGALLLFALGFIWQFRKISGSSTR